MYNQKKKKEHVIQYKIVQMYPSHEYVTLSSNKQEFLEDAPRLKTENALN